MIKYQNVEIPVFSIPPDWTTNVLLSERFGGLIVEALSTAEERLGTQPRPLYSIAFDTLALSEQETGYARKIIESAAGQPIAIPLWPFKRVLTADPVIGNSFVKCDAIAGAIFDLVPYSILWNGFNYFETFRTFAVGSDAIQFADPITKQFSAGDVVVPVIVGHFARDAAPAVTDSLSRFPVKFDEQFIAELFATPNVVAGTKVNHQPAFEYLLVGGPIL